MKLSTVRLFTAALLVRIDTTLGFAFHPAGISKAALVATSGASYALYSFVIDKYAARVVKRMQSVPTPEKIKENAEEALSDVAGMGSPSVPIAIPTPAQLRTTVSKRTNIVAKCDDRMNWNRWIAASRNANQSMDSKDLLSLCGTRHRFKYRTYANFEEAGAICKPFYTWKRIGFMFRRPGELKFVSSTNTEDASAKKEANRKKGNGSSGPDPVALVTIKDEFLLGILFPLTIQWWGEVQVVPRKKENDGFRIDWTRTEMEITLPFGKKIVKENPKASTKLSSTPWDIEKLEEGMICFRRGDIGHLVYDSK